MADEEERGGLKRALVRSWFWFSQITTVVGLISIIDDLKSWRRAFDAVSAVLERLWPTLAHVLVWAARQLHELVLAWRAIAHPIVEFLFGWVSFHLPLGLKDVLAVGLIWGVSWLRIKLMHDPMFYRSFDNEREAQQAILRRYGLTTEQARVVYYNAEFYRKAKRREVGIDSHIRRIMDEFEWYLGDNSDIVADQIVNIKESMDYKRLKLSEIANIANRSTNICVIIVTAAMVVDYVAYHIVQAGVPFLTVLAVSIAAFFGERSCR